MGCELTAQPMMKSVFLHTTARRREIYQNNGTLIAMSRESRRRLSGQLKLGQKISPIGLDFGHALIDCCI
jgi:hypothetical protein